MVRLRTRRVSPRRIIYFRRVSGGFTGDETSVTPLVADAAGRWLRGRGDRRTHEQTDKQMDMDIANA